MTKLNLATLSTISGGGKSAPKNDCAPAPKNDCAPAKNSKCS